MFQTPNRQQVNTSIVLCIIGSIRISRVSKYDTHKGHDVCEGESGVVGCITDMAIFFPLFLMTIEYELCSGRGLCDFISGTCQCFSDFAGANCGFVDYDTTLDSSNSDPGMSLSAIGLDYTGNIGEYV